MCLRKTIFILLKLKLIKIINSNLNQIQYNINNYYLYTIGISFCSLLYIIIIWSIYNNIIIIFTYNEYIFMIFIKF